LSFFIPLDFSTITFFVAFAFIIIYFFLFLHLLALDSAIATACFCGLPDLISALMFELIVFDEHPDFNGIILNVLSLQR
jgi:hypothetical protein